MCFIWLEMLKIAPVSGAPPQTPLGTTIPRPPSREGLLAFGNRSFAPSALAISQIFSRSVPPKLDTDFRLWLVLLCKRIHVYEKGEWPDDFNKSIVVPIEKKANATECGDFRTISLIPHA